MKTFKATALTLAIFASLETSALAIDTVAHIDLSPQEVEECIRTITQSKNQEDQAVALRVLRDNQPAPSAVLPLVEFVKDKSNDSYLRRLGIEAIAPSSRLLEETNAAFGGTVEPVVLALAEIIDDKAERDDLAAQSAIGIVTMHPSGWLARSAVSTLIKAVERPDSGTLLRREAVTSLGEFGFQARNALPMLLEVLDRHSALVRTSIYRRTAVAFGAIASTLENRTGDLGDFELIGIYQQLERGKRLLNDTGSDDFGNEERQIGLSMNRLQTEINSRTAIKYFFILFRFVGSSFLWSVVVMAYLALLLGWTVLLLFRTGVIASVDHWLSGVTIEIGKFIKCPKINVGYLLAFLLLVRFFVRFRRVRMCLETKTSESHSYEKSNDS